MTKIKTELKPILLVQALGTALLAMILLIFTRVDIAYSATCGGAIYWLAQWVMARRIAQCPVNVSPKLALRLFYQGAILKWLVTASLFAAAALAVTLDPLSLFLGYLAAHFSWWFAPLLLSLGN